MAPTIAVDQATEHADQPTKHIEADMDDWELDVKACRLDGRVMAEGELCEACQ